MARPFHLIDQVTPVSLKCTNIQKNLQKGSVHVNRMKQCFTYDGPAIDSPPQCNPTGNTPEENYEPLELFTESPGNRNIGLADNMLPNNSQNVTTNHIEDLTKINLLAELSKSLQLKQKI